MRGNVDILIDLSDKGIQALQVGHISNQAITQIQSKVTRINEIEDSLKEISRNSRAPISMQSKLMDLSERVITSRQANQPDSGLNKLDDVDLF